MTLPTAYEIQIVPLDRAGDIARASAERTADIRPTSFHFPDAGWLQAGFSESLAISLVTLTRELQPVGVMWVAERIWPLRFRIGRLGLGSLRVNTLRLLGGIPALPEDADVSSAMILDLLRKAKGGALFLESVPQSSFLWQEVCKSGKSGQFRCYVPGGPSPRHQVRIQRTFEEYLGRFSAKTRNTRLRKERRLAEAAKVELVRVSQPGEVDSYIDAAVAISKRTYQYRELGLGINDEAIFRRRLTEAAARGWLRSYLLRCDGEPVAFVIGYQYNGVYYYSNVGHAPEWAEHSVGSVLLLALLRDLHSENAPALVDFGPGGGYKEQYSTESYTEVEALLYLPGTRLAAAIAVHRAFDAAVLRAKALARRLNNTVMLRTALARWRASRGGVERLARGT